MDAKVDEVAIAHTLALCFEHFRWSLMSALSPGATLLTFHSVVMTAWGVGVVQV